MTASSNWLNIIINPPQQESVKPGDTSQIKVVVTNKKQQGLLVEVYLELPTTLRQWCKFARQSFNLNPQQSQEILFQWQIPAQALSGAYNYALIVDSPRNFSSPLRYNRKIEILLPPVINSSRQAVDPTFWILPDTSSTKPIILQSGQSLTTQIFVHNRSQQVDEYRLDCDLDDTWYTLSYPEGIAEPGLVSSSSQLNLLPNAKGQITLVLHPPKDTFAGNYRPDIRLHSSVKPDLFLQKIFYFNIPPQYALQANLQTILNKVRRKHGKYKIELNNQGNTIRELEITVKTADEDELCQYDLERSRLRIPPGKTTIIALKVKPIKQQGRSFFRAKQYTFQVQIEDLNQEPLPKNLPLKESLFWKPRPWGQFVFLLLLLAGVVAGSIFLVMSLVAKFSVAPEITSIKSAQSSYEYDNSAIAINWGVKYPQKIKQVNVWNISNSKSKRCYYFNSKTKIDKCDLIDLKKLPNNCTFIEPTLNCTNLRFVATQKPGEYTFTIEAIPYKQEKITKEAKVTRKEKAIAAIDKITTDQKYKPSQDIILKFNLSNPEVIKEIYLLENGETKHNITSEITKICKPDGSECKKNIGKRGDGKYTFGLKIIHARQGYINPPKPVIKEAAEIAVKTPISLESFTINNQNKSPIEIKSGQQPVISWKITGKEVKISITGIGETLTQNQGYRTLNPFPDGTSKDFTIKATDIYGHSIEPKTLTINVESPPPEPDIDIKDLWPELLEKLNTEQ